MATNEQRTGLGRLAAALTAMALIGGCDVAEQQGDQVGMASAALKARPLVSKNPFAGSVWQKSRERKGVRAVQVKFRDGLTMRLRSGQPSAEGKGDLLDKRTSETFAKLRGGSWQRSLPFSPETLDKLRERTKRASGRAAPDMNLYFTYSLPDGLSMSEAIGLLEQLPDLTLVYALPEYTVAALPDYTFPSGGAVPYQAYLEPASSGGMDAFAAWNLPGGDGKGVDFVDVEFGFDADHYELGGVHAEFAGATPDYIDHGTAAMAVVVANADGPGVTGFAPEAGKYFASARDGLFSGLTDLADNYCDDINPSISACATLEGAILYPLISETLSRGDVMLLELQMRGPNAPPDGQFGMVPVEYNPAVFDAIRLLAQSGIVVVEAAANGSQDLDDPVYAVSSHRPFRMKNGVRAQDSGAILVGAVASGMPWSWSLADGSPLPAGMPRSFSNFGGRVDVHAWGDGVVTAGYGDLYGSAEPILKYTQGYSGTSSASALVAGAATSLQGVYHADHLGSGRPAYFDDHLWGPTMRDLLQRTGANARRLQDLPSGQQASVAASVLLNTDVGVNVGQRPNLDEATKLVLANAPAFGAPLPPPVLSMPTSAILERDGQSATIGIRYGGNVPVGSYRGVVDILYTVDGSEPNCSPRCGGCDTDRVHALTQVSNWRAGSTIVLNMSEGPVTVRARTALMDCAVPYGEEVTATYY